VSNGLRRSQHRRIVAGIPVIGGMVHLLENPATQTGSRRHWKTLEPPVRFGIQEAE
jgi:hypothetical protein